MQSRSAPVNQNLFRIVDSAELVVACIAAECSTARYSSCLGFENAVESRQKGASSSFSRSFLLPEKKTQCNAASRLIVGFNATEMIEIKEHRTNSTAYFKILYDFKIPPSNPEGESALLLRQSVDFDRIRFR